MFPDLGRCGRIEDVGLDVRWDAAALSGEVARRAAVLARHGIGPGSVVAISHSGSAFFFADLFAAWSIGAAAACLDGSLTERELANVAAFVKPAVFLVRRMKTVRPLPILPAGVPALELADSPAPAQPAPAVDVDPDSPALILFTSGTTGDPKGVVLSFRALGERIRLNAAAIGRAALRRALVTLPTHFGHGLIGNALTPFLSGGDIVLYPSGALRGDQLGRVIDTHAITFLSSVPALWGLVIRTGAPPAGNSLVRVHVGSAPLSAKAWSEIAAWTRAEVVNCFGMTETANWIAGASSRTDGIADGLIGRPWGGAAGVLDDSGVIRPSGTGEIVVRSPSITSGYFNRPDLTAAVMIDGWFRTGDRGSVDEQGRIRLTGRIKDEINRAGFKVQPAEIDMVIETHPAVAEACVFGIPDPVSGEVVGVAIRLQDQTVADAEDLQGWCRERMRREAVPEHWFTVTEIPRNARGKVNRDAVRRRLTDAAGKSAGTLPDVDAFFYVAANGAPGAALNVSKPLPADPTSASRVTAAVERAWTSVVGRPSFHADTPWDQAGGDSLGAMRLWLQIEQQLAVPLPLERMEFNTTPSRLIDVIERLVEASGQGTAAVDASPSRRPLVFLLPPAHGVTVALAQFHAAFNGRVRVEVIRYPVLEEFLDRGGQFDLLVDAAVAQIRAHGGRDACYLAGYSFGGFVAWEVARRLLDHGCQVGFLGLIDTRLIAPRRARKGVVGRARGFMRSPSFRDAWASAYADAEWRFFELLVRNCSPSTLRRIHRVAGMLPGSAGVMFQWELMARVRTHAFRREAIRPLDLAVTLFRSDEQAGEALDYGWSPMCRQLEVLPVRGSHLSLFNPENREILCSLFIEAVATAQAARHTAARGQDGIKEDGVAFRVPAVEGRTRG